MSHPNPTASAWDAVHMNLTNPADVETQLQAAVEKP